MNGQLQLITRLSYITRICVTRPQWVKCQYNHLWIPSITFLLTLNGLGDIWHDPPMTCGRFHQLFKNRLNDPFIQDWSSIASSIRFATRHTLSNEYTIPTYIKMRNPHIRLLYTRLKTDLNILSTSQASKKAKRILPLYVTTNRNGILFYHTLPIFGKWDE